MIRVNPLTFNRIVAGAAGVAGVVVVASVAGVVVLSACLWAHQFGGTSVGHVSWAALWAISMGLCWIPFRKQIDIAPAELSIRNWWDVVCGNVGIVRTIGPESSLVDVRNGSFWLAGPDPL